MAISTHLIDRLTTLTQQHKLEWEQVGRDVFRTSTANTELRVWADGPRCTLAIYDEIGNLLGREEESGEGKISLLYEAVRRLALNVDGKLAALERSLRTLGEL